MMRHHSRSAVVPALPFTRLCVIAALATVHPLHADCELLFAPADIRARALAFHHAGEQRRTLEHLSSVATAVAPRARNGDSPDTGNHSRKEATPAAPPRSR
jgi:hypothetical protein